MSVPSLLPTLATTRVEACLKWDIIIKLEILIDADKTPQLIPTYLYLNSSVRLTTSTQYDKVSTSEQNKSDFFLW